MRPNNAALVYEWSYPPQCKSEALIGFQHLFADAGLVPPSQQVGEKRRILSSTMDMGKTKSPG